MRRNGSRPVSARPSRTTALTIAHSIARPFETHTQAHFTAPSSERRKLMSSTLAKELKGALGIKSLPIKKGDKVRVMRGGRNNKGLEGVVTCVYRKKWAVHVAGLDREKKNGQRIPIPFDASNLAIVQLGEMTKDRQALINRKRESKGVEGSWDVNEVSVVG